ncbi:MAG TPA: hypothetical protein VFL57_21245, partial [Bryobacteraceae bacterium]|nr:hypothetical protein [Bryobacteraceae bacterium]
MQKNGNLPAVVDRRVQPAAQPQAATCVQPPAPDFDGAQPSVPLSHYLWILRRHRWKIAGFVAACVLATLIISVRLVPVYEATATIDIDR